MNHADPESPINDIRIRQALAMVVDNEVYVERRTTGVQPVANGPFSPDQALRRQFLLERTLEELAARVLR